MCSTPDIEVSVEPTVVGGGGIVESRCRFKRHPNTQTPKHPNTQTPKHPNTYLDMASPNSSLKLSCAL